MSKSTPNPLNYYIGKGIVAFQKAGTVGYRDLGNAPVFEVAPDITKLDHFSSRAGVKQKDRSVVTEKSGKVNVTLEEVTLENLQLMLMGGDIETDTAGRKAFQIFGSNQIDGSLKFTGTNDVGSRFEVIVSNVSFVPGNSFNPISEEWGVLELTGDMLADDAGSFGTVTEITADDAEEASSA